ncbi:hypothetical protein TrispH2_004206 [Trichoplax sp. H2]|nr:hypothetical protein TrispH2_004206 [Trichoplax sp. H2]|eukprot:RDD43964.1 hypothetical protein TrispH2_004206 [Trichoplax sp. H2]
MEGNYQAELDWGIEKIKKLIDLYRENEVLWNVWHPHYKNRAVRYMAWKEMAKKLHCQPIVTEKKMNSLRTQFFREHQRMISTRRSGVAANSIYQSTWPFFESLKFLRDVQAPLPTWSTPLSKEEIYGQRSQPSSVISSMPKMEVIANKSESSHGKEAFDSLPNRSTNPSASIQRSSKLSNRENCKKTPVKRSESPEWTITEIGNDRSKRSKSDNNGTEKALKTMNELKIQEGQVEDDYDHFGKLVGNELRKVLDSTSLQWTKWKIIDLIYQQTMPKSNPYTRMIACKSSEDLNPSVSCLCHYRHPCYQPSNGIEKTDERENNSKSIELMETIITNNTQRVKSIDSIHDKVSSFSHTRNIIEECRPKVIIEHKSLQTLSPAVENLNKQTEQTVHHHVIYKFVHYTTVSPISTSTNSFSSSFLDDFDTTDVDHFC